MSRIGGLRGLKLSPSPSASPPKQVRKEQSLSKKFRDGMERLLQVDKFEDNSDSYVEEADKKEKLQIIEVAVHLFENRQKVEHAHFVIMKDRFGKSSVEAKAEGKRDFVMDMDKPWPSQYTKWNAIPHYFFWGYLDKFSGGQEGAFGEIMVTELCRAEPSLVVKLKEMFWGLKASSPLDVVLHDKRSMVLFLQLIGESRGSRAEDWSSLALCKSGIDWMKPGVGCFSLHNPDEDGFAQECWWHISKLRVEKAQIDKAEKIPIKGPIKDNHKDMTAGVNSRMGMKFLCRLFDDDIQKEVAAWTTVDFHNKILDDLKKRKEEKSKQVAEEEQTTTLNISQEMTQAARKRRRVKGPPQLCDGNADDAAIEEAPPVAAHNAAPVPAPGEAPVEEAPTAAVEEAPVEEAPPAPEEAPVEEAPTAATGEEIPQAPVVENLDDEEDD